MSDRQGLIVHNNEVSSLRELCKNCLSFVFTAIFNNNNNSFAIYDTNVIWSKFKRVYLKKIEKGEYLLNLPRKSLLHIFWIDLPVVGEKRRLTYCNNIRRHIVIFHCV